MTIIIYQIESCFDTKKTNRSNRIYPHIFEPKFHGSDYLTTSSSLVAPYEVVLCSWSLGIQFDHLNYILSNSILLIPMSSRVLKLSTKSVRIIWNHSLGCWKKSFYLHIYIFLNFRFKIIYPLIVFFFLREQIPKKQRYFALKNLCFLSFFLSLFSTLCFVS